jgi:hypothetical protein
LSEFLQTFNEILQTLSEFLQTFNEILQTLSEILWREGEITSPKAQTRVVFVTTRVLREK